MNNRRVARHIETRPKEWGCWEVGKGFCRGPFQPLVRAFSRLPPSTRGVGIDKFIKIDAGYQSYRSNSLSYGDRVGGLQVDSARQQEGGAV